MIRSRLELETLSVLDSRDNRLHHRTTMLGIGQKFNNQIFIDIFNLTYIEGPYSYHMSVLYFIC